MDKISLILKMMIKNNCNLLDSSFIVTINNLYNL